MKLISLSKILPSRGISCVAIVIITLLDRLYILLYILLANWRVHKFIHIFLFIYIRSITYASRFAIGTRRNILEEISSKISPILHAYLPSNGDSKQVDLSSNR